MTEISVSRSSDKKEGTPCGIPIQTDICRNRLASDYYDPPLRIDALGMSVDTVIITKRDVNQTALIGRHGRKAHGTMLLHGARSCRAGNARDLLIATALVTLNVHHNRIAEPELTAYQERDHRLERFERSTMTPDENSQIRRRHVKDELALIALIFIDGGIGGIEVTQDIADNGQRDIGDGIKLGIRQLLTSFIASGNLRILTCLNLGLRRLDNPLSHDALQ